MFDLVNLDKNSLNDVITNTAIRKNLSPALIEKDLLHSNPKVDTRLDTYYAS